MRQSSALGHRCTAYSEGMMANRRKTRTCAGVSVSIISNCSTHCRAWLEQYHARGLCAANSVSNEAELQQHHAPHVQHSCARPTPAAAGRPESLAETRSSRRQMLLHSTLAPFLVQMALGSDDATTIVNSVLSAYGLPTLKAAAGFKLYDEFEDEFYFEYPRSWVSRPNSLRRGVYISDFQTADKVTVEELELPEDGDITTAAVAAAVAPGGGRMQDDRINLPAQRLVKTSTAEVDGQEFLYLEFPSETITRSGYNIRRKNFAAAAARRGKLYTIAASARSDQFNEDKKQLLQHIVQSFRLR